MFGNEDHPVPVSDLTQTLSLRGETGAHTPLIGPRLSRGAASPGRHLPDPGPLDRVVELDSEMADGEG